VPQVTHAGSGDDDRVIGRRIVARLRRATQARLLEVELRPGQIKGLCGRMRWFVGTRMHSNIFALSMGVPTLAIGYLPKTVGLMETIGLEEWTLPIETLTAYQLEEAFARLVAREQEVRGRLAQRIPELTRAAMDNGRTIEEALSRWCGSRGEA
jgi:colanic acid/amylovoran biosynthesis protein